MILRVGHLGEVGRFLDNAPDVGTIIRPKTVPRSRRAIVFMPRWFYLVALAACLGLGLVIGHTA